MEGGKVMENNFIKKMLILVMPILIGLSMCHFVHAAELNRSMQGDEVILTVGAGEGKGEVGLSATIRGGGGTGPVTFAVDSDGTVYISDNMNDRVNVYKNGEFLYDIKLPYSFISSMVIVKEFIYLLNPGEDEGGEIYVLDKKGNLVRSITLPEYMEEYRMLRLCVRDDGSVWLEYMPGIDDDAGEPETYYQVDSLMNGPIVKMRGYSKNGIDIYDVKYKDKSEKVLNINKTDVLRSIKDTNAIEIASQEGRISAGILGIDKSGLVFADVFEDVGGSMIAGESTVRAYSEDVCIGISKTDVNSDYHFPSESLKITEDGDLYQMVCLKGKVEILKKGFTAPADFKSEIDSIKEEVKEKNLEEERKEREEREFEEKTVVNAPNDRKTTEQNAIAACELHWTYNKENAKKPKGAKVEAPTYLKNGKKSRKGIPYCWGGFDGISTSSSPYSWSDFSDAMSKGKFAGNIDASTAGYQGGTAGLVWIARVLYLLWRVSQVNYRQLTSLLQFI